MIDIRPLLALPEMQDAVLLQRSYWGDDLESVIPVHMLFSLARHGGHVLAAFAGDAMAGVLVGFLGTDIERDGPAPSKLQIVSKRMVVLPEYRNQGIAYQLKMAQRDATMQQGLDLVTWTFDPLLATNAHLNIRKLGAICTRFYQDYYGTADWGGLVLLGTSDRVWVEWRLREPPVEARVSATHEALRLRDYLDNGTPILNPALAADLPWPAQAVSAVREQQVLLEIPRDYMAIVRADEALARAWRAHIREQLHHLMQAGYRIVDFVGDHYEGRDRVFYVLSRARE
jgi:predicted GNAT superfamily acetyltransferase